MASYLGSFNLTLQARYDDGVTLVGTGAAPWTLADLRFDDQGNLLGSSLANANSMWLAATYPDGTVEQVLTTLRVPGLDFTTALDGFALPIAPFLQEFGDGWTQTVTLAADRTSITYSGQVAFDEIDDGFRLVGTLSATATLLLDNSWPRFSLRALDSEVAEGAPARFEMTRSGNIAIAASAPWSVSWSGAWQPHVSERLGLVAAGPGGDVAALTIVGWTLEMLDYWRMGRHFGHDPASGNDYLLIRQDLFLGT